MKVASFTLLVLAGMLFAEMPNFRLFILPPWADSTCEPLPSVDSIFTANPPSNFKIVEGLERDVLISQYGLDSCHAPSCVAPAAQSGVATWMLVLRQQRLDSMHCESKMELVNASPIRVLKTWSLADSSQKPFPELVKILADTVQAHLVGGIRITSDPVGATVHGFSTNPMSTPFEKASMLQGLYSFEIQMAGYKSVRDSFHVVAGTVVEKNYKLEHTQAYLDSVAEAKRRARLDSIVNQAKQTPETQLSALFQKLLNIQVQGTPAVALLPFETSLDSAQIKKLGYNPGVMASEFGIVQLRKDTRFRIVERQQLDLILQEQALQQSDLIEGIQGVEPGKILAVQFIIVGNVVLQGSTQNFFAKMIDTRSGEIVAAASATVLGSQNEDLYRVSLGERASSSGAVFRSLVAPGWGQFYTNHPEHGWVFLGLATASLGWMGYCVKDMVDKQSMVDKFKDHDPSIVREGEPAQDWVDRANAAVADRNDASSKLNIALAGVGAVWILNLVDAYWLGEREAKAIRTQYFSFLPLIEPRNFGVQAILSF